MIRRPPTSTRTTPPFPTRRSSDLQQFLPGIGTLVERSGASTLPAYIDGAFEAMPRWAKVPRLHPITVRFGAAQPAEVLRGGSDGGAAEHIHAALRERRSDELRVGKECVSTCSSRWSPYH